MAYTPEQIYAMAAEQSAAGFSNQDIATGAQRLGITADQLSGAYAAARPELFSAPGSAQTMADYTQTLFPSTPKPYTMDVNGGSAPTLNQNYQRNPYLDQMADDIGRRTQQGLGQAFNGIRSNSVGVGGLGGSRQGVAEGVATSGAMDSMQGQLAGLFGTDYTNSMNRNLQAYGIDSSTWLGARGQNQNYALGVGGLENQRYGQDQSFYTAQRGQDLQQTGMGANIYDMGVKGGWIPLDKASDIYKGYTGLNSSQTTGGQSGGGASGVIGGALAGASFGKSMGWWG